jgi:DNA-binding SARP family transcriptional activator
MGELALNLFGAIRVSVGDEEVSRFPSDKVRALLAYLAVESDRPHRREVLAGLLWPDWPERDARRNLSWALSSLRTAIHDREAEPSFLLVDRHALQFNEACNYWLDVRVFMELIAKCDKHEHPVMEACDQCMDRLERAVEMYRGEFLEGFSVADSLAFEEWCVVERERLRRMGVRSMQRLVACHEWRGDYQRALDHAWRQLELDVWREEAHRQLMRLLALVGRRSEALAQYETCRRVLAQELGVEPGPEMLKLYGQIRDGEVGPAAAAAVVRPAAHTFQLPAFLTGEEPAYVDEPVFVAREGELARLDAFLAQAMAGEGRVVFVVGEAGSGKTALLREFSRRAQDEHADLVVASGSCNAYGGIGDPYHPFREVLGLLTGDVEPRMAAGAIRRQQAERLWGMLPVVGEVVVAEGPDLVDVFVSGAGLLARCSACGLSQEPWATRLEALVRRGEGPGGDPGFAQSDLFRQYVRVLQGVARDRPLVLVLDDLQWADAGSVSLLFHLGQELVGSPILVLGAYRPEEIAVGGDEEGHPLAAVVNELRGRYGDTVVDLGETAGRELVEELVDSEANRLGEGFRDRLWVQTHGHALFTVELLQGMKDTGELVRDEDGHWVEAEELNWERVPPAVGVAIEGRIERLPSELRRVLAVASVEGEVGGV